MHRFHWPSIVRASIVTSLVVLPACSPAAEGVDAPTMDSADLDAPLDAPALDVSSLDAPSVVDAPSMVDAPALDAPPTTDTPVVDAQPSLDPNCDPDDVLCDAIPPACDEGEVPTVEGSCWGECIPANECQCETFDDCPEVTGYSEVCYSAGHCGPAL
jgi:hypothetical protein